MSEICLGIITAYDPVAATVDIRTHKGATFPAIPFDSSMGLYSTPVVAKVAELPDGTIGVKKAGTFVLYSALTDGNVRLLRMLNDDQSLVAAFSGRTMREAKGIVQDTLVYMLQEGETLLTAPGKIYEHTPGQFVREHGAWALLKNSGDMLLSNADTSAQMFLDRDGKLDLRGTNFSIAGPSAHIYEDTDGSLILGAGPQREFQASITAGAAGLLTLQGGTSSVTVESDLVEINTTDVNVTVGGTITLHAPEIDLSASNVAVESNTIAVSASESLAVSAKDATVTADSTLAIDAPVTSIKAATSVDVNVGTSSISIDGTKMALTADSEVTITIGDSVITVSSAGIDISASAPITFNNGTLYAVAATAAGPIPAGPVVAGTLVAVSMVKMSA